MNKGFRERLLRLADFLEGKGFYIVILLCILMIGLTITLVTFRDFNKLNLALADYSDNELKTDSKLSTETKSEEKKKEPKTVIDAESSVATQDKSKEIVGEMGHKPIIKREYTIKKNIVEEKVPIKKVIKEAKKETNKEIKKEVVKEPLKLDWPVYGKIIKNYSGNTLVYSETLNQWTTHSGVDISSKKGEPVKAVADGTVLSIKEDPGLGITITIEHRGGIRTVYSNLSTDKMLKAGQKVKRGKVISGVGETAGFESEDQPHLHFEVIKNGEIINPTEYLETM